MRTLLVILNVGSAAAAVWLSREDAAISDAPGQVVAEESKIAAVETGRLAQLLVRPGQRVEAGQLLARLDTSVLEREIAVAQARLKQYGAETNASAAVMESDGYASERSFQADLDDASAQLESARVEQTRQATESETSGDGDRTADAAGKARAGEDGPDRRVGDPEETVGRCRGAMAAADQRAGAAAEGRIGAAGAVAVTA